MKQPNTWHPAERVAKALKLANGLGPQVRVADKLCADARNPFVGCGLVGMNGAVYLAVGGVAPYTPKKGENAGEPQLSWGYNAKAFLRIHSHEPVSTMADLKRIREALESITEADVEAAIVAAKADSSAPRSRGVGSLAEILG